MARPGPFYTGTSCLSNRPPRLFALLRIIVPLPPPHPHPFKAKSYLLRLLFEDVRYLPKGSTNSINWPASNVWVFIAQLESTAALTRRPRVRIPLKPRKLFFGLFSQLFKLRFTAMVTYSFHLYSRSSHHFIQCFIPFTG